MISRCSERIAIANGSARAARRDAHEACGHAREQDRVRERAHAAHRRARPSREPLDAEVLDDLVRRRARCPRASAPGTSADRCRRCADRSTPGRSSRSSCRASSRRSRSSGACRSAWPGPTISSHQPGVGSSALEAACADGDRPVKISTALSRFWFERAPGLVGDRRAHAASRPDASGTRLRSRRSCAPSMPPRSSAARKKE